MRLPPFWVKEDHRTRRIQRMSRRAFLGVGLAAGIATSADANLIWLKGHPATSPFFATVNSAATLNTLLGLIRATPATYAGKIIGVLDGDYSAGALGGGERFNFTGIAAASTVLFYGVGENTAVWPGLDFGASTNVIIERVAQYRGAFDSLKGVCIGNGYTSCGFNNCEVSSIPLNTLDYRFKVSVSGGTGGFSEGEAVFTYNTLNGTPTGVGGNYTADGSSSSVYVITNSTSINPGQAVYSTQIAKWNSKILQNADGSKWVQLAASCNVSQLGGAGVNLLIGFYGNGTGLFINNCYWHDLKNAFTDTSVGPNNGANIQYNHWYDIYGSYHAFGFAFHDVVIKWNVGEHLWSTDRDGCPGTAGPHSSICGWGVSNFGTSQNVQFQMNVYVPGFHRLQYPLNKGGGIPSKPSGPEMNDQGTTSAVGGTGGVSTDVLTVSSINGAAPVIAAGMSLRYAGGSDDGTLTILPFGSGGTTGTGLTGTYKLSRAVTIPASTALHITTINDTWDIRGNLILSGSSIGWEFAYTQNTKFLWNTIISPLDKTTTPYAYGPSSCNLDSHDQYTGTIASKNVFNGFDVLGGYNAADYYANSTDNVNILFGTGTGGATDSSGSGPASYNGNYAGKTGVGTTADFQQLDAAGALAAFTPKGGSRVAVGNYGHSAYVNFTNRTTSFPADPVAVSSSVANGIATNTVTFDGTTVRSKWIGAANAPLLDISGTTSNVFTLIVQFSIAADGSDDARFTYIGVAKNSAYSLTRNADGTLKFLMRSNATTSCLIAQTSFTVMGADGLVTVAFTVDLANYKVWATKGNHVDPFLFVTTATGLPLFLINGGNNANIGSDYSSSSNRFKGVMGVISINDAFLDVSQASVLSKVIAQDNLPVSYGSDGSTLYGSAAKVAINNVAGAADGSTPNTWNATAGVNNGTTSTKFIKQAGTYT